MVLSDLFSQVSHTLPHHKYYQDNWDKNIEPNEVTKIPQNMSLYGLRGDQNRSISSVGLFNRQYNFNDVDVSGSVTNEYLFTGGK